MSWNKDAAVNYARNHAGSASQHRCAHFVSNTYVLAVPSLSIQTMQKIWHLTYAQQVFELCMAPQ